MKAGPKRIGRLTRGFDARLLDARLTQHTGLPLEVWVIHEAGNPGASEAQVELFQGKDGVWTAWTGSIVRESIKQLARVLAVRRNKYA